MKIRNIFIALLFMSVAAFGQFQQVSVMDIQFLPDSVISLGDAPSPLNGDTVIVQGVCIVAPLVDQQTDRRPIIWAGSRWVSYIQDESGQVWGGVNIIQDDTTGDNQLTYFQNVDTADVIQLVGVVTEYYTTTELIILLEPLSEVEVVNTLDKRPDPIVLSISDFMDNGNYVNEAEKYEGMYVEIREGVTSDRNLSNGTFTINDGNGNHIYMYDQSGFFTLRGHRLSGITDYEPPQDGSSIVSIKGIMQTRTDGYYITPIYPGDIVTNYEAPTISDIERDIAYAKPNESVEITSNMFDANGTISEAFVHYSVNGEDYESVAMQFVQDSSYAGTIPAISQDSAIVKYFVSAIDNDGNRTTNPFDTTSSPYFYIVKSGDLTIHDVQYSPFGNGYSSLHNFEVTVQGVVTADSNDFDSYIYIQDGEGAWNGVRIFGVEAEGLVKGDLVEVTGPVTSSYSITQIGSIDQGVEVNLLSQGNALPDPVVVPTGEVGQNSDGYVDAEKYESVLITYENVSVIAANADDPSNFGEMLIDDNTGGTRVELQDGNLTYHNLWDPALADSAGMKQVFTGDTFDSITGILYYSFGDYKLQPRTDADLVGFTTDVEDLNILPETYSISQNYPNPFNPSTKIQFSLPEASNVKVKIYDVLGREVARLVNEYKNAGTYTVNFNASNLSSGIYFYSLEAGDFHTVKKMTLLK